MTMVVVQMPFEWWLGLNPDGRVTLRRWLQDHGYKSDNQTSSSLPSPTFSLGKMIFEFNDEESALLFKLVWGGK